MRYAVEVEVKGISAVEGASCIKAGDGGVGARIFLNVGDEVVKGRKQRMVLERRRVGKARGEDVRSCECFLELMSEL